MLNRNMENWKKTQFKSLKIKIIPSEMKNTLDGINDRLATTEENISKLEYLVIGTIQNENPELGVWGGGTKNQWSVKQLQMDKYIYVIVIFKREGEQTRQKTYLKI